MQKVELGHIFKISSGGTPNRSNTNFYGGEIPWIKTGDLKGKYLTIPKEKITDEGLNKSSAKIFPKNTVLLAMYGATIGACSILPFEAATNQACAALLPTEKCNEIYLYYFLISFKDELIKLGVGGAQPNISAGIIKKIEIPLPTLPTQQKIAGILDTADQLRQYNKQLIEKYDALTQSLFLEMFGDIVINSKKWEKKTLKEISIRFSDGPFGSNLKTEHYSENGIQVIRLQNIGINKFNNNGNDKSFVDETHYNNVLKKYSCYPNDIVIATMGNPNIRACVIPNNITVAVNKADCVLLRVNSNIANQIYIANLLNLEAFLNLAVSFIHGQTRSRISSGQLAKIEIPIPPIELQNQFAERVQMIETQKQQAQEALIKSEELFQSLLQRAFKGELN